MEDVEENNGMNCGKIKKACFIASSGGHWEELMCLGEIADAYDTFFVTEEGGQAKDSNLKKIYTLPQINRHEKRFFWHFFKLFKSALKILKKEKPDFVITTGIDCFSVLHFCKTPRNKDYLHRVFCSC